MIDDLSRQVRQGQRTTVSGCMDVSPVASEWEFDLFFAIVGWSLAAEVMQRQVVPPVIRRSSYGKRGSYFAL
jgi:hypothetical protein